MELLIATLAHTVKGSHDESVGRVRLVLEKVKNAPGMVDARLYCGRNAETTYLILSAWEDGELWRKAQVQYNPKELLLRSMGDLLTAPPEQWRMHYLWGYSRISVQATIAEAHVATVEPTMVERVAHNWLDGLRQQAASPTLAFAFLARGNSEDMLSRYGQNGLHSDGERTAPDSTLLNVLSWPSETQRKEFYADQHYMALRGFIHNAGVVRVLPLEPA